MIYTFTNTHNLAFLLFSIFNDFLFIFKVSKTQHILKLSNFEFQKTHQIHTIYFLFQLSKLSCFHGWASTWEHEKTSSCNTIIVYKRYREILFQNVALCYLLHFVQDGSPKTRTRTFAFAQKRQYLYICRYWYVPWCMEYYTMRVHIDLYIILDTVNYFIIYFILLYAAYMF